MSAFSPDEPAFVKQLCGGSRISTAPWTGRSIRDNIQIASMPPGNLDIDLAAAPFDRFTTVQRLGADRAGMRLPSMRVTSCMSGATGRPV